MALELGPEGPRVERAGDMAPAEAQEWEVASIFCKAVSDVGKGR